MTNKYRLLIDSPEHLIGTTAEPHPEDPNIYKVFPPGEKQSWGLLNKIFIENRPTVWQLIEEPKPSFKNWRAENGGQYFFINEDGTPQMAIDDYEDWDNYRHLTDNYFQELAKCEHRKCVKEAIGRVTHAIIEANEGWEPDWEDGNQSKYIIHYDHYNSKLDALHVFKNRIPVILPFCKTTNIAISIISSHKEDLDLIFNVKK